jgi:hypothetical protein
MRHQLNSARIQKSPDYIKKGTRESIGPMLVGPMAIGPKMQSDRLKKTILYRSF